MVTVVKRQIRATPHRTASGVWELITDLIAPDPNSSARRELSSVAGVLGQVIASDAPESDPIVVFGNGPRVRFYCLYDEAAITGDDANEGPLAFNATEGDWRMSVAALVDDVDWVRGELKKLSNRITVREIGEQLEESVESAGSKSPKVAVDVTSFLRS